MYSNKGSARFVVGGLRFSVAYANGNNIQQMMKDYHYPFSRCKFKVHHGYFPELTSNNIAMHDIIVHCGSSLFLFQDLSKEMIRGWEVDNFDD